MASKVYVGGIPFEYGEDELRGIFENIGEIVSATVISDKFSGRSKGFGFVEFQSKEEADKAVQELNGSDAGGRRITVDHARPPRQRDDREGGGYNRR